MAIIIYILIWWQTFCDNHDRNETIISIYGFSFLMFYFWFRLDTKLYDGMQIEIYSGWHTGEIPETTIHFFMVQLFALYYLICFRLSDVYICILSLTYLTAMPRHVYTYMHTAVGSWMAI